ncbi:MAG TPA: hypothetical protein VGS97_27835 [Actinocrinis sp.]|uniref:hypothetical protein n=1 Tax=Actinocrinis sp. TaxID=1920516 RepID=UPI002DDD669D|nr:hypothetical protein [Actinocrinis sp.]HEV2347930.1 hypothetical protein [Actinocrinis sp.]
MNQEQNSPSWPGVPCDSDAWPYSSDVKVFEARRAVGQLAKTFGSGLNPPGLEDDGDADPALRYIYAVGLLEAALGEIRKDLVAEARTREVPWAQIGLSLNISKQGAYNRFGAGVSAARLGRLKDEAMTCWVSAEVAKPRAVPPHIAAGLDGATPGDRMNYLARQAIDIISDIRDRNLLVPDQPAREDVLEAMKSAGRKIRRLGLLVTADHAMWKAATDSSRRPEDINQANYYTPATYLLHVMRLLILAWVSVPDDDCEDIDRYRAGLDTASRIYANVVLLLERDDVSSVVPCQCGNTWNRCDGTCVARP